jgi:hypothetical protein
MVVMTEILFVLTVIYVAYILYIVGGDKKAIAKSVTPVEEPEKQVVSVQLAAIEPVPKKPAKPLKTDTAKPVKSTTTKKPVATKKGLKDPKTGDIATTYNNYRFTKRWIKEALVTEGLLEKIYKNNELNADIETIIKAAIAELETMEQYKAYN